MEQLLTIVKAAADEKKAKEPLILDLEGISNVTDYFFICSGQTQVQVRAIADNIIDKIQESQLTLPTKEGYTDGRWILLDFGNVVVHVMQDSEREFYSLEDLWHDAKLIPVAD